MALDTSFPAVFRPRRELLPGLATLEVLQRLQVLQSLTYALETVMSAWNQPPKASKRPRILGFYMCVGVVLLLLLLMLLLYIIGFQ